MSDVTVFHSFQRSSLCYLFCLDPSRLEETVRNIVLRYGSRLWNLRIMQAELKVTIRFSPDGRQFPIRLFLTNESGYYLDISMYKEVTEPKSGAVMLEAYGARKGRHHGLLLDSPYQTKDHLQIKRFEAKKRGTQYVYDLPDIFISALEQTWSVEDGRVSEDTSSSWREKCPRELMTATELVLDKHGKLLPLGRNRGCNDIGMVSANRAC